ncbi:hypothetical protein ACFQ0M_46150 [Kitasatospora aburaviensis]
MEAGDWAVAVGAAVVALVLLGVVLSASSAYTASRIWPWLTSRLPWDVAGLVDVAHRRGVLRQNGAAYRFGHLSLQQRLAAQGGHVPAHRAAAVTARRAGRVLRVAGTTTVGALLFIGASGISTVVEGLPAPPGPRTMPSACALLTGADFQQVLGGDFVQGQFTTHAKCAWSHERDPARGWPSVYLDVEAHGPFLGKSGTQDAKSDFEAAVQYLLDPKPFPGSSRLLHHVVGLGDEAVTKVGNTGVVIVKARADNLIFDLTLAPAATEESFTTEDDTLRNADLAERLLHRPHPARPARRPTGTLSAERLPAGGAPSTTTLRATPHLRCTAAGPVRGAGPAGVGWCLRSRGRLVVLQPCDGGGTVIA